MTTTNLTDPPGAELTDLAEVIATSQDPLDRLAAIAHLKGALDDMVPTLVAEARADGHSNALIGQHMGICRQAVAKRFPRASAPAEELDPNRRPSPTSPPQPQPQPEFVGVLRWLPIRVLNIYSVRKMP